MKIVDIIDLKKISVVILFIALFVALTGCSSYGAVKKVVAENGADAKDETLEAAIWYMCTAASVGSVKRRFKSPEEIAAYNVLCPDKLPGAE